MILDLERAVGHSVFQCQALEKCLVHVLLLGPKVQRGTPGDVVQELLDKTSELTLGQLVKQISQSSDVPPQMLEQLTKLKVERNWLVHRSWSDTLPHINTAPPRLLNSYIHRITSLGDEALELALMFNRILDERLIRFGVSQKEIDEMTEEFYRRLVAG